MNWTGVVFDPPFDGWLVGVLAALAILPALWTVIRRLRGGLARLGAAVLLTLALANPSIREEIRDPLKDVVLVLVDRTASQGLSDRRQRTERALERLREQVAAFPNLDMRVAAVTDDGDSGGSYLFRAYDRALADVPRDRLAAVIALSDGAVHDDPADFPAELKAPFHLFLSGRPGEVDRRLELEQATSFALVGGEGRITLKVVDDPASATGAAPVIRARASDGREASGRAEPGQTTTIVLPVDRAGETVFEVEVDPLPGEVTDRNNRVIVSMRGVRDRLRVLLVSGRPHPGERAWRNLLKSDPSVDLVHFTILRPPGKAVFIPSRELSLIQFPVVELFERKLDNFDLVVFDRYVVRQLLPMRYFGGIVDYVRGGGALLVAVGTEFLELDGLDSTPLNAALLGHPLGSPVQAPFRPQVTELGHRHPITASMADIQARWSRLFRVIQVEAVEGAASLIADDDGRPLVQVGRLGEGRVAQINSDQFWLWARGLEGGGPFNELMRRIAHWLMREPSLEEEIILAEPNGEGGLSITRRSLLDQVPPVIVTDPAGRTTEVPLSVPERGLARATIAAAEQGIYKISDGALTTAVAVGEPRPAEFLNPRATPRYLQPMVDRTGGGVAWLGADGEIPNLRRVRLEGSASGTTGTGQWVGLVRNERYSVVGLKRHSMTLGIGAAAFMLLLLAGTWWREGR